MNPVRRLSPVLIAIVAITSSAGAQRLAGPGRPTAGIFAGVTFPFGDFKDEVGTGWHACGLVKMRAYGALDVRVDGAYSKFGKKDIQGSTLKLTTDGNVTYFTVNLLANLAPDSAAYPGDKTNSPYLFGGLGRYRLAYDETCEEVNSGGTACSLYNPTVRRTYGGANIGAGVSVPFLGLRSFVEIRYHRISRPLSDGSTRSMFTASAGVKIR